jgi:hypothetical protein
MSSPENGPATTVVIEMGPGWIYVTIAEPKPEPHIVSEESSPHLVVHVTL